MTEDQKTLILDLALGRLSEDQFLTKYLQQRGDLTRIRVDIDDARIKRDATQLECNIILMFHFGGARECSDLLCRLLLENWHMQHENIALLLKDLKDPASTEFLYRAALTTFAYLDYDDSHALAVKCIYALGAIGTEEAKGKLRALALSENSIIRENANLQLTHGQA